MCPRMTEAFRRIKENPVAYAKHKERAKRWAEQNKEKAKAARKRYIQGNGREKHNARQRKRYQENYLWRAKMCEYQRKYKTRSKG